jgi:hypothetical protein
MGGKPMRAPMASQSAPELPSQAASSLPARSSGLGRQQRPVISSAVLAPFLGSFQCLYGSDVGLGHHPAAARHLGRTLSAPPLPSLPGDRVAHAARCLAGNRDMGPPMCAGKPQGHPGKAHDHDPVLRALPPCGLALGVVVYRLPRRNLIRSFRDVGQCCVASTGHAAYRAGTLPVCRLCSKSLAALCLRLQFACVHVPPRFGDGHCGTRQVDFTRCDLWAWRGCEIASSRPG